MFPRPQKQRDPIFNDYSIIIYVVSDFDIHQHILKVPTILQAKCVPPNFDKLRPSSSVFI
jgi:hypothetical protein